MSVTRRVIANTSEDRCGNELICVFSLCRGCKRFVAGRWVRDSATSFAPSTLKNSPS